MPTTLLNSETHTMNSARTGRAYRITVSLPLAYHKTAGEGWPFDRTPDPWPAVYVLDGNWYDAMVAGMIRPMAWCGGTTDAIVVGIGYPEGDDAVEAFRVSFTRRDHDLTPARDEATEQAQAAAHSRPVPNGEERLRESATHGFKRAIVPKGNAPKSGAFKGLEVVAVERLSQALDDAFAAKYDWRPSAESSEPVGEGNFVLRPRVAYAWTTFPADVTRWTFGER